MEFTKIGLLLTVGLVLGCQASVENDSTSEASSKMADKTSHNGCGAIPPIRDKSKIADNLRKQGVITDDMDQQEVNQVVADYIRQRQKQFAKCPKPTLKQPSR